jgi:hypothetical protein
MSKTSRNTLWLFICLALIVGVFVFSDGVEHLWKKPVVALVQDRGQDQPAPNPAKLAQLEPSQYDMAATLLAGKVPASGLPEGLGKKDWEEYVAIVTQNWGQYNRSIGQPMKEWATLEIKTDSSTVFYPFSGPDFTTLYQLYPNQQHYMMSALQKAEKLIDLRALNPKAADQTLEVLSSAWKSYGHDGFFVTEYLYKYLSTNNVRIGATTLIATFLNLQNFSIRRIVPIQVGEQGEIKELPEEGPWNSVRFYLIKDGREVMLDYVRMDLSDDGFAKSPENYAFIKSAVKNPVVFKAASHLPQHREFALIKQAVLESSPSVVQDETGIGYADLNKNFDTTLYGQFVKAHKVFTRFNHDLAKAYQDRTDEKPLPFRVGYYKDGTYSFVVAKRKVIQ